MEAAEFTYTSFAYGGKGFLENRVAAFLDREAAFTRENSWHQLAMRYQPAVCAEDGMSHPGKTASRRVIEELERMDVVPDRGDVFVIKIDRKQDRNVGHGGG